MALREPAVHWKAPRLHGVLCNRYHRRHEPRVTNDLAEVTCSTCLGLLAERALKVAGRQHNDGSSDG